jgi:hypothetical protein
MDPNVSPVGQSSCDDENRQRYVDMGRPISDFLEHNDPVSSKLKYLLVLKYVNNTELRLRIIF